MGKKRLFRDARGFETMYYYREVKNMKNSYKFSFVCSIFGFVFAIIGLLFLFSDNPRLNELSNQFALLAVAITLFTMFNLIPTQEETDIKEERQETDINHRFESVWRELDRLSDKVNNCSNSCTKSSKSR